MNPFKEKSKILVVGSTNTDMVVRTDHLPRPGETVLGGVFMMNPGGKGANQAVAAARLGGDVVFVCKTGNDIFGITTRQQLFAEGIDIRYAFTDDKNPSGVALIAVDRHAENSIVVASGANANLLPLDISLAEPAMDECGIVLMQLETPLQTIAYVIAEAVKRHKKVILNPAPAVVLSEDLLRHLYLITPNQTEAEMISGISISGPESTAAAAQKIRRMGVENVIITLGSAGSYLCTAQINEMIPAFKVDAVDTTAAGDVFNGALVVALAEGHTLSEAIRFASKASAISVTRIGAQSSAPYRNEVDLFCC